MAKKEEVKNDKSKARRTNEWTVEAELVDEKTIETTTETREIRGIDLEQKNNLKRKEKPSIKNKIKNILKKEK